MRLDHLVRTVFFVAIVFSLPGCADAVGPDEQTPSVSEGQLIFIRAAEDAPPLEDTIVSFWAVSGENREVEIRYLSNGKYPGGKCLTFKVRGNGLLRHPDGRTFARGDSVQITIRVIDPARYLFEFQPAGLKFDPDHPAEMEVSYRWADRDFNGDGQTDGEDQRIEDAFAIWRQEKRSDPWSRIATVKIKDLEEVRAEIDGFTRYAVASN